MPWWSEKMVGLADRVQIVPGEQIAGRGATLRPAFSNAVWPPPSGSFRKIIAVQVRWPPLFSISGQ